MGRRVGGLGVDDLTIQKLARAIANELSHVIHRPMNQWEVMEKQANALPTDLTIHEPIKRKRGRPRKNERA